MDDVVVLTHLVDPVEAADDLRETLALMRVFVAVLLSEQPGPLTPVQRDLLDTINERVSCLMSDDM
jgi:hypothetical protein